MGFDLGLEFLKDMEEVESPSSLSMGVDLQIYDTCCDLGQSLREVEEDTRPSENRQTLHCAAGVLPKQMACVAESSRRVFAHSDSRVGTSSAVYHVGQNRLLKEVMLS